MKNVLNFAGFRFLSVRQKILWSSLTSIFLVLCAFLFSRDVQFVLQDRSQGLYQTSQVLAQLLPERNLQMARSSKDENEPVLTALTEQLLSLREQLHINGDLLISHREGDRFSFIAGTDPDRRLGDGLVLPDALTKAAQGERFEADFEWDGSQSHFWTVLPLTSDGVYLNLRSNESGVFFRIANLVLHYVMLLGVLSAILVAWGILRTQDTKLKLARAEKIIADLFEYGRSRFAVMDANGHLTQANTAFLDHFGLTLDELVGLSPFTPNEVFNLVPVDQALDELASKARQNRSFRVRAKVLSGAEQVSLSEIQFLFQSSQREFLLIFDDLNSAVAATAEDQSEKGQFLDSETGLPHFSFLKSKLETQWEQFKKQTACLLFIDLDDFQEIKKDHGTEISMTLIKEFGNYLKKFFRASDLVVRMKEDQFIVLLRETDAKAAQTIAENLLQKAKAANQQRSHFSIGIAPLSSDDTLDDWVARAYAALKNAKLDGKGRAETQTSDDLVIES